MIASRRLLLRAEPLFRPSIVQASHSRVLSFQQTRLFSNTNNTNSNNNNNNNNNNNANNNGNNNNKNNAGVENKNGEAKTSGSEAKTNGSEAKTNGNEAKINDNEAKTNGNGNGNGNGNPLEARIKELEQQLEQTKKLVEEGKEELLIAFADRENTRRIAKRDVDNARHFGIQSFATALLDVADNLHRALDAVNKEVMATNAPLKQLHEGVELTGKELSKVFTKFEVVKFHPLGDKFNPAIHQALVEVADPTKEPGTVSFVMKSGFMLRDKLLRPASVGVVKAAPPPPPPPSTEETKKPDS